MSAHRNVTIPVQVNRFQLEVPIPLEEFELRYEQAVPALDAAAVFALADRDAPWSEMLELIGNAAPFGFLIYWKNQAHTVMRLAGDMSPCIAYLMGNHTIAERMFRHDASALLYAPLRTVMWQDDDRTVWFAVDQPSGQFSSFGIQAISDVGRELDAKLGVLLDHLGLEVPSQLEATAVDASC
jgi:hypothetical protein